MARWFETPLGTATLSAELSVIGRGIRRFHGDSMLWLSPGLVNTEILARCMVRHKFYGVLAYNALSAAGAQPGYFHTDVDSLPIGTSGLQGIVAHHAIDCAQDPRVAIRELARALSPGGYLLVVGFNPFSVWYLRALYSRLKEDVFTDVKFVSPYRLVDWLKVLGFEIDGKLSYLMHRPPFEIASIHTENWHAGFGGVYYLLARKVSTHIPLTGILQNQHTVSGGVLPQTLMNKA